MVAVLRPLSCRPPAVKTNAAVASRDSAAPGCPTNRNPKRPNVDRASAGVNAHTKASGAVRAHESDRLEWIRTLLNGPPLSVAFSLTALSCTLAWLPRLILSVPVPAAVPSTNVTVREAGSNALATLLLPLLTTGVVGGELELFAPKGVGVEAGLGVDAGSTIDAGASAVTGAVGVGVGVGVAPTDRWAVALTMLTAAPPGGPT